MPRVIIHERVEDYNKKRLLKLQELTGMSRGKILDDLLWLAETIVDHPGLIEDNTVLKSRMDRILDAKAHTQKNKEEN